MYFLSFRESRGSDFLFFLAQHRNPIYMWFVQGMILGLWLAI